MKIVITGGHHTSALPVIKKLKEKVPDVEILWVGHKYSMLNDKNPTLEFREITSMGIPFFEIKAGKLYKTYNIVRLLKVPFGFFHALYFLLRNKPDVIMSFGGYIAAPVVLAGYFLKIPSLTHEQTVVAGYSNKLISKFVKKVLISWKESEIYFPKDKTVFTGIPLRPDIFKISSNSFDINKELMTLYISAGKTGSHILNEAVRGCLKELLTFCNVVHQCGDNSVYNDFEKLENRYREIRDSARGRYFLRRFVLEDEIGEAYLKSDLAVSRSGAHTVSEIIALKKPALLIPIPWVSHDEQNKNAEMVKDKGLAEILEQKDLTSEVLVEKIKYCISNIGSYKLKDESVLDFLKEEPADIITNEIIQVYKAKKK
ncbi:UDP-N-acetylglucosamine--N-acetylmuramyl-(pentapeptide) pyrophosphoryl-undecaprenol N-acetylglucosamine transferase [Patescibacteria group bacterium]|nr:UDP-N-acetylglucosamine--N-acetylmuramyl-(pentapeptide) pyrophosphoryl-undecaprenol N-acetylglucosamine transferase [Patescibacteria group bacterium]